MVAGIHTRAVGQHRRDTVAVNSSLGPPDSVVVTLNDPRCEDWYYGALTLGLRDGWVYAVLLSNPEYASYRGLRVGDPLSRVIDLYGNPHVETTNEWRYCRTMRGRTSAFRGECVSVNINGDSVAKISWVHRYVGHVK